MEVKWKEQELWNALPNERVHTSVEPRVHTVISEQNHSLSSELEREPFLIFGSCAVISAIGFWDKYMYAVSMMQL